MRHLVATATLTFLLIWIVQETSAGVAVSHKALGKHEVVADIPFDQILDYSRFQGQTTLVIGDPEDACSALNSPPPAQKESLHPSESTNLQWTVLLRHSNACSWRSRAIRARNKGYVGIIAYSTNEKEELEFWSYDWDSLNRLRMNVSQVTQEDAEILKKYSFPQPYAISFHTDVDWTEVMKVLSTLWFFFYTSMFFVIPVYLWKEWGKLEERRERERRQTSQNALRMDKKLLRLARYQNLLGVSAEATSTEIQTAYKRKCLEYHEDSTRRQGFPEEEIQRRAEIFKTELPKARRALLKRCELHGR